MSTACANCIFRLTSGNLKCWANCIIDRPCSMTVYRLKYLPLRYFHSRVLILPFLTPHFLCARIPYSLNEAPHKFLFPFGPPPFLQYPAGVSPPLGCRYIERDVVKLLLSRS